LVTTKQTGGEAEERALGHLQRQGLRLIERNYRVARGPQARGGEIDLIMQTRDGTLVFVEVRSRGGSAFGGALSSISPGKQRSLVFAARSFLMRYRSHPPCRFDVVSIEGASLDWVQAAFDAVLVRG
jgi:putative endonuclease